MSVDDDLMRETPFARVVELCRELEMTSSRLGKRKLIADFLRTLDLEEIPPAVLLTIGKIFPESEQKALNIGWSTLQKALSGGRQATLVEGHLTIGEVEGLFRRIALTGGRDSMRIKRRVLESMLSKASAEERDIILRNIFGEMRHGVSEGVMLEAIADASAADLDLVQRAHMFCGDIGKTAQVALGQSERGLREVSLRLFTPIKPMMAEMAEDLEDILEEHGGRTALEYKFDGARIQIHKRGDEVRIFSRRLTDVTKSIPEIVEIARDLKAESFLLEGEVVAIDSRGRPRPFQELMRRFRRVHEIEESMREVPLKLYLFDCLYLNGEMLIDAPYEKRWDLLSSVPPQEMLAPRIVASSVEDLEGFLRRSMEEGHEGLMAKDLRSAYTPGKRGKKWFKIKLADLLDVVIIAGEWGHGRRQGWISNYHLAVRDEEGNFHMIGKTFKGLTDDEFEAMTKRLLDLRVSEDELTVYVRPEVVVEVAYNEIQRSPHYRSGYALRFARIKRIREDKGPWEIDTIGRLAELYERQFEKKGEPVEKPSRSRNKHI